MAFIFNGGQFYYVAYYRPSQHRLNLSNTTRKDPYKVLEICNEGLFTIKLIVPHLAQADILKYDQIRPLQKVQENIVVHLQ